jgi:excinuclease ABC subunit C
LLEGKGRRDKLDELREEMSREAEAMHFEKAALLRDVIQNLEITLNPTRQFSRGRGLPSTVKPTEDLAELGEWLHLPGPPRVMECFDISNVSSNHIVASMVRFVDGVADNQAYRRYRIKTVSGQDDFASMAEVVRRRYSRILLENAQANPDIAAESQENVIEIQRRLAREGKAKVLLPDLVIVDGGKGQLSMAVAELRKLKLHDLPVIGLAKQREEVFRPGHSEPILIPHDRGALKLLQRIRDEAHRFANGYNSLLLRRRMKESVLDDCPLINAARKKSLFKHFGSVTELRKATCAEIEACPGINKAVAQALFAWLEVRK